MKLKTVLIAGAILLIGAGGIGYAMVSQAGQGKEFAVLESGIVEGVDKPVESDNQVINLTEKTETIYRMESGDDRDSASDVYNLHDNEDKVSIAKDALMEYFDTDVSNLQSEIVEMSRTDDYDGSLMVIFFTNPGDYSAPFYNVLFDPKDNFISIKEVYIEFRDSSGGGKIVEKSVTVDEAKVMAEEFIKEKELADTEKMELIGGKVTSEGRIHVTYKIGEDETITVGIDLYDNQIKSFFKNSLEYGENLIYSRPEDAVG